ncbi:DoxX family protein [Candidatus Peregrinibacteria bacterium]|nr:DoxX family protein [Candidatus Peregrinibacteria bacterium]
MKKTNVLHNVNWQNFALLVLRVCIGAIFLYAGWMKLTDMANVIGMFGQFGWPVPAFFAYLVAIVETVAGGLMILGILTRIDAVLLAAVMIVALITVHIPAGKWDAGIQLVITLLAGNLALTATGGGMWRVWSKDCPCS